VRGNGENPADGTDPGGEFSHRDKGAIAVHCGSIDWTVDDAGWAVILMSPEAQTFSGRTLEEALAWCLVWLMAQELGSGPLVV
jgi:hypothetical protein